LKVNRRFGGTYRIHLQEQIISQARNQHEAGSKKTSACYLLHAGFLLGFFFDSEDGDMFFRNVVCFSTDYTALYPGR
jgi:hypothetical protein